jgi:hypothetical protein
MKLKENTGSDQRQAFEATQSEIKVKFAQHPGDASGEEYVRSKEQAVQRQGFHDCPSSSPPFCAGAPASDPPAGPAPVPFYPERAEGIGPPPLFE